MFERILTKNIDIPNSEKIDTYIANGGYRAFKKALNEFTPDEVTAEVKNSGLRGRGGAGFPAGVKWGFVPKNTSDPVYLCCNADESEPGTFKDRLLMEKDPHLVLEGIMISCYAINSSCAYIYVRGEFVRAASILERAIKEAYEKNYLGKNILGKGFDLDIFVHRGAGAYICGEESALLESLEGKVGWPRLRPPFPAVKGLFSCPTIINNVETLANVPFIIQNGAEWFASIGTEKNTGPKLYCISGHVNKPGVYEFPMGIVLRELIYEHAGGIINGNKLKAVIPGGTSAQVLSADEIDVRMDFDSVAKAGSMLGSAGVIVMDETVCMVGALLNVSKFYAHESCGQCTPCREGTTWAKDIIARIEHGKGSMRDLDVLIDIAGNMKGKTVCPFGDAAALPIESFVTKFRSEFEAHIQDQRCPMREAA